MPHFPTSIPLTLVCSIAFGFSEFFHMYQFIWCHSFIAFISPPLSPSFSSSSYHRNNILFYISFEKLKYTHAFEYICNVKLKWDVYWWFPFNGTTTKSSSFTFVECRISIQMYCISTQFIHNESEQHPSIEKREHFEYMFNCWSLKILVEKKRISCVYKYKLFGLLLSISWMGGDGIGHFTDEYNANVALAKRKLQML